MADWKSGLRQAADQLGLFSKPKDRAAVPVSVPVSIRPVSRVPDERPAVPRMPDYPTGSSGNAAPGRATTPAVGTSSRLDAHPPSRAEVAATTTDPLARKPAPTSGNRVRPLPPGLRSAGYSIPRTRLEQRGNPVGAIKPLQAPPAKAKFSAPDMAKHTVCFGAADACADQGWQEVGTALTLQPWQNRGRQQCTVGLDFGTAFTKACVQFRQSTFVVHWDRAIQHCAPVLLPCVFTVEPDGSCVLGAASGGRVRSDLKMSLLTGPTADSKINATAFLALVTRYIRSWVFSRHGNAFSGFHIEWFVNVGLPAVPWDDLAVRDLYRSIAFAGWQLGALGGPVTIEAAASVLAQVEAGTGVQPGDLQKERFGAFPEFVAQINSYRKSPQRRRDLHLLVDVGAGTVDIVSFHVWEPEETDRYLILKASVKSRGTHVLLGYRANAGGLDHVRWDEESAGFSRRQFEAKFGLCPGKLGPVQEYFVDRFRISLEQLLRQTKARRYETSPAWNEGVPFFLCGGGRNVDAYREATRRIGTKWRLLEMQLPWPDGLVHGELAPSDFHRVSVAHGLSYSQENIGEIERESEVPDLVRTVSATVDYTSGYIDK